MKEAIDKYIAENPQDVMIFEELFNRAGMTNDEKNVFWSAVGRFFDTVASVLEDPDE